MSDGDGVVCGGLGGGDVEGEECFFFQAEDGIRDLVRSRGLGDVCKRQVWCVVCGVWCAVCGVWCVVCGVWCVVCLVLIHI